MKRISCFVDEFGPLESKGLTKPLNYRENAAQNFVGIAAQVHTVLGQYVASMALTEGKERDDLHELIKKRINMQLTLNWSEGTPEIIFVDGKPILRRPPSDLKSAIWLGLIQLMQLQIVCLQCAWCKIWFRPKRRKKSNAKHSFCSKNCRTQFSNREIAKTKRKEKR